MQVVLRYASSALAPASPVAITAHTASSCPPLYLYHLLSLLGPLLFVFTAPCVPCLPRSCYSDTSCPQEDQYPPNIAVKVNHSYCSVPVSQPTAARARGDMDAG